MDCVICAKWFDSRRLGVPLKNSPTIFGTVIKIVIYLTPLWPGL